MRNTPSPWNPANQCTDDSSNTGSNDGRPAPDDNDGGVITFMTWKLQDQLSNGLNNVKDPITNPNREDLGGGYLSDADLIEMESICVMQKILLSTGEMKAITNLLVLLR